jgi:hypothetical protein
MVVMLPVSSSIGLTAIQMAELLGIYRLKGEISIWFKVEELTHLELKAVGEICGCTGVDPAMENRIKSPFKVKRSVL